MTIRLPAVLSQLENLEREFVGHLQSLGITDMGLLTELLFVINEAFTNAFRHGDSKGREISIEINASTEESCPVLTLSVEDFGKGIRLNGAPPPYPSDFLDREFILAETIDGSVIAKVTGTAHLQIDFREAPKQGEAFDRTVDRLKYGGMGLSIISKIMDTVAYEHAPNHNLLTMKKQIPPA